MSRDTPTDHNVSSQTHGYSRRNFIAAAAGSAAAPLAATLASGQTATAPAADPQAPVTFALQINGKPQQFTIDTRTALLDALREHAGLTGSKKGCDHGQCGACTVLIGGRRVLSCLTLAISAQNQEITTIEGLAKDGELHPMQTAFVDHDAFQCGYCTPGQIVSAVACVNEGHANTDAEIREYMSGNLCRCAAYPNIVAAINQAKTQMAAAPAQQKGG